MFHKCICWLQCSKIDPDLEMFLRCSHSFLGTLAPSDIHRTRRAVRDWTLVGDVALEDRSPSSHFLGSVRTNSLRLSDEVVGRVPLMNVLPRIGTVAEERNLSLSLPDDEEQLRGIMSHVLVRSLEGWWGRVVYRMDASRWEMELHIPLGLDEGDRIFSTLTDAHDSPERSASPASYHGKILEFDEGNE